MPKRRGTIGGNGGPPKRRQGLRASSLKIRLESIIFQGFDYEQDKTNNVPSIRLSNDEAEEIVTICEQHPSLATSTFHKDITPLAFLITCRASLAVIQSFCQKFPDALKVKWTIAAEWDKCLNGNAPRKRLHEKRWRSSPEGLPLKTACYVAGNLARGTISFLVESYPEAANSNSIVDLLQNHRTATLRDVKPLVDAVVRCGGFQQQEGDQATVLECAFLYCRYKSVIEYIIPHCPHVSHFKHRSYESEVRVDHSRNMAKLLPQLVKLDIDINWKLLGPASWQTFTRVLQGSHRLQELTLRLWNQGQSWYCPGSGRLVPHWVWAPLNSAIGSIPTLKTLFLTKDLDMPNGDEGVTDAVVSILGHNTLENLTLKGFRADLHAIIQALKQSGTLREFQVQDCVECCHREELLEYLKAENTTLTRLGSHFLGATMPPRWRSNSVGWYDELGIQLNYYCELNKLGRGLARDASTSADVLAGLLTKAMLTRDNTLGKLFGLLQHFTFYGKKAWSQPATREAWFVLAANATNICDIVYLGTNMHPTLWD
ncbi:expressed unknown protein [Seminavis robusta]|uniref:Uncharacterized protein n=1 Tax=Seminavis robusta TaxID=568900 RepID=A0A9N8HIG3_9STRA|nr:expressed unknown protein [Seminavis robusta]|eukprot:Sro593_g172250.1 n/a (543) ;mRNA; f:13849-15549